MSIELIGFFIILGLGFAFLALWFYIEDLKYRLKNMEFDRDMYARLYELYKPQPKNDK